MPPLYRSRDRLWHRAFILCFPVFPLWPGLCFPVFPLCVARPVFPCGSPVARLCFPVCVFPLWPGTVTHDPLFGSSKMDVIGFGESSVDYVHVVEDLPRNGASKVRIASHYSSCGGQVATTMTACAALGLTAGYLGPLGNDDNGRRVREALRERAVDISRVIVRDAPNRFAVILVDRASGERIVFWDRDPGLDIPPAELSAAMIAGARIVHLDGTDEAASIALAKMARQQAAIVTLDIDDVTPRTPELLASATVAIVAEHVPRLLTGISDTEAALRAMATRHGARPCVTLGSRGSAALDGNRFVHAPAVAVEAVDTTGAGDVFRAGFILGLLREWPVERTLRFANAVAAVSCTRTGAITGAPSLADVEPYLR